MTVVKLLSTVALVVIILILVSDPEPEQGPLVVPTKNPDERTTSGPYGFTSTPGTSPPVIASGTFRNALWELRGEPQLRSRRVVRLELELVVKDSPLEVVSLEVVRGADRLLLAHQAPDLLDGTAEVVFGAVAPRVDSVAVDFPLAPEPSVAPHLFTDHETPTGAPIDYFLAFIPPDVNGFVSARNQLGIDLDIGEINGGVPSPRIAGGQVGNPTSEFDRARHAGYWWLDFRGHPDRACLALQSSLGTKSRCFTRVEIDAQRPLLVRTFLGEDVTCVVAILRGDVEGVRLQLPGEKSTVLPLTQPLSYQLRRWPLRIAVVGVVPGTTGTLDAFDATGGVIQRVNF